jgi:hypothetical protein
MNITRTTKPGTVSRAVRQVSPDTARREHAQQLARAEGSRIHAAVRDLPARNGHAVPRQHPVRR